MKDSKPTSNLLPDGRHAFERYKKTQFCGVKIDNYARCGLTALNGIHLSDDIVDDRAVPFVAPTADSPEVFRGTVVSSEGLVRKSDYDALATDNQVRAGAWSELYEKTCAELTEAEAERDRLKLENERLREALRQIRDSQESDLGVYAEFCVETARAALAEKEGE